MGGTKLTCSLLLQKTNLHEFPIGCRICCGGPVYCYTCSSVCSVEKIQLSGPCFNIRLLQNRFAFCYMWIMQYNLEENFHVNIHKHVVATLLYDFVLRSMKFVQPHSQAFDAVIKTPAKTWRPIYVHTASAELSLYGCLIFSFREITKLFSR